MENEYYFINKKSVAVTISYIGGIPYKELPDRCKVNKSCFRFKNDDKVKRVLTLVDDGSYQVCDMFINEEGKWEWSYNGTVLYWMPIPKLEEEQS